MMALSDFLGVPRAPAATAAPMAAAPVAPARVPTDHLDPALLARMAARRPADAPTIGHAVPRGTAPPPTQSSYVLLRAPTGEQQSVPAEQASYYLARGATRV